MRRIASPACLRCIRAASSAPRVHAGARALPFVLGAADAEARFAAWCAEHTPFARPPPLVRPVRSVLLPFWAFRARLGDAPAAAGPSLQVYAGAELPRPMAEVAKAPAAAALAAPPFSVAALRVPGGGEAAVEAFATYETTAWALARAAHLGSQPAAADASAARAPPRWADIESARLLLPVHVLTYTHLWTEFRVVVNAVTGAAFGLAQRPALGALAGLLARARDGAGGAGVRSAAELGRAVARNPSLAAPLYGAVEALLRGLGRPALKLLFWPPLLAGAALSLAAYAVANATHGLRAERAVFSRWAEERRAEARAQAALDDTWLFRRDDGAQRQRAQQSAQPQERRQARQQAARSSPPPPPAMPPPVDANDLYACLGLAARAPADVSTQDIQAAFRRELLKYHPDHAASSGFDPAACSERARIIIAAYTVLRDPAKRRAYDAGQVQRRRR
jgi:hypothetical protein